MIEGDPDDLSRFCCMNPGCAEHGKRGAGNLTVSHLYGKSRRMLRCRSCKARFSERKGTPRSGAHPAEAEAGVDYRTLADFPGFRFGSDGSVQTAWQLIVLTGRRGTRSEIGPVWRTMSPSVGRRGYQQVALMRASGKRSNVYVHRLILEAFVGPCPPGQECRHLDGDPTNNRIDNLRWGTKSENHHDKARHGTSIHGEANPRAVLDRSSVAEIRRLYLSGWRQARLAEAYGVSKMTISLVCREKTWSDLDPAGSWPGDPED